MKRSVILAALLVLSGPALSQSLDHSAPITDPSTTSALPGDLDLAMSALRDARANANAVADIKAVSQLTYVKLSELTRGAPPAALTSAIEDGINDRTGLQAAIKSNQAVADRLASDNVDISTVVAGRLEQDGALTLYLE